MSTATLQQKLTRVIPTDVLKSEQFHDLVQVFRPEDDDDVSSDPDPVHPMTLSPKVLLDPKTRFYTPRPPPTVAKAALAAGTAAVVAATSSGWSSWLTWKTGLVVLLGGYVLFMAFKNWRMARDLGFSYALAASLPPLRPVVAMCLGTTSDNIYAEIESYQLGVHPVLMPPPQPKLKIKEEPKVVTFDDVEAERDQLLAALMLQVPNENVGTPTPASAPVEQQ